MDLTDYLVCPACNSNVKQRGPESLICENCGELYKIVENIPIMLPASQTIQDKRFTKSVEMFTSDPEYRMGGIWIKHNEMSFLRENIDMEGKVILDAGGGAGHIAREMVNAKVVFLCDLSFSQLSAVPDASNVIPIRANIEYPILKPKTDIIICTHVLEHLNAPLKALAMFHSILKENGKLFIVVPILNIFFLRDEIISLNRKLKHIEECDHLRVYSSKTLIEDISNSGFIIEKIKYTSFFPNLTKNYKFLNKEFAHTMSAICCKEK